MIRQKYWFTLVELIVVITILAILWTIAFISLQWYSRSARDSSRLTNLKNIEKALEFQLLKGSKIPIPKEWITFGSDGKTIWYQSSTTKDILDKISVHWVFEYDEIIYRINGNGTSYQLMWFMESGPSNVSITNKSYAIDLSERFPYTKWKILWIFLESWTNKPLQEIASWTLDIRASTTLSDIYFTNWKIVTENINNIYWEIEILAKKQDFYKLPKCPAGFIAVSWNINFLQPSFCVAKYEMSYDWMMDNVWWNNIYWYASNSWSRPTLWSIVSKAWNPPIGELYQSEAIAECIAMWDWYHLITNNEWMTISRDIELNPINWSSWEVWNGNIPIWFSYDGDGSFGCSWVNNVLTLPISSASWTITWHEICDWKNKLKLSNWVEIWDFSWNVWEYVNKGNTLDWSKFNLWRFTLWWTKLIDWSDAWDTWEDYGIYDSTDMDKNASINGYWKDMWMWRVYNWNWVDNNVLLRGWALTPDLRTWIYAMQLDRTNIRRDSRNWFRCAK